MATLRYYLRIYLMIEAQYIKARMQYRADFIISAIGMFTTSLTGLAVFWVLFETIPQLDGWTFHEMMFIYGFYLLAVTPLQIFFDNIWQLRWKLIDGSFIKYYFRPLNMMFYYMAEVIDIKGFTQLVLGIIIIGYASIKLSLQWTIFKLLLLILSLGSASLVIISLLVIAASVAFWILDSFPIIALAFRVREFSQYPMTIMDGFFRFLFTYAVPIGFVAFYPSQFFLRPEENHFLVVLSPVVGLLFFALAYKIWTMGVNNYTGTGS